MVAFDGRRKVTLAGAAEAATLGAIVRVIGIVCGEGRFADEIITWPLYVPAGKPAGFAATVTLFGVEPDSGPINNQLPPEVVLALTVNGTLLLESVLDKLICCCGTVEEPTGRLKLIDVGAMFSKGLALTLKVTGIVIEFAAPVALIVMVPLQVCGVVPAVNTDALNVPGVVPLAWLRVNQLPPQLLLAAATV